jgi:hypothetical protein
MADVSRPAPDDGGGMSPVTLVLAFLPWIAYLVVVGLAGPAGVPWAALLSLAIAVGLVVAALVRRRSPKILVLTSGVVFGVYTVLGFAVPATEGFLAGYGRGLAAILLALVIFVSLPVMPFTEQFARDSVPRQYWDDPQFRAVNRRISAVWGAAIGGSGVCNLVATALLDQHGGPLAVVVRVVLPVLFLVGALRYTQRTAATAGAHAPHAAA